MREGDRKDREKELRKEKVVAVVRKMRDGKTTGVDKLPAEV